MFSNCDQSQETRLCAGKMAFLGCFSSILQSMISDISVFFGDETSMMKWLNDNLEAALGGLLLAGIVILITVQVVMRYVFQNALSWSEELTLWSFIWFIWIGIAYAFKERKHVKVTFFQDLLPANAKRMLEVVIDIAIVVFLITMTYQSYKLITLPYVLSQKSVVLNLPIAIMYASAPVGSLLSVFRILQFYVAKPAQTSSAVGV